jgi:hypothetical protein
MDSSTKAISMDSSTKAISMDSVIDYELHHIHTTTTLQAALGLPTAGVCADHELCHCTGDVTTLQAALGLPTTVHVYGVRFPTEVCTRG